MRSRWFTRSALVGAALAAFAAPAAANAAGPPSAAHELLPVWATFDGDTPVVGGRVEVFENGRRVPQASGVQVERTHATGVAVLELPRRLRSFTVVVTGGTAHGRPVNGELRRDVRGYGPVPHVVHVNPVTTIIAATVRRGHGHAAAERIVRRLLHLPHWHDVTTDLRRNDDWFGGDAFLAAARREGLNRLVSRLSRPGHPRRRFRDPEARTSAIGLAPIAAYLKEPALNFLKDFAIDKGKDVVAQILAGTGLAGADVFDSAEIREIRQRFDQVDARLLELKGIVEGISVTLNETLLATRAGPVVTALGNIRTATENLNWLAKLPPTEPTKANLTREYANFIRDNLQGVPRTLDDVLGGEGAPPQTPNILQAASRLVASQTRFFDAAQSARVQAVYDYYALAQARAAVALHFYWRTRPDTFSDATIAAELAKIEKAIAEQKRRWLKPAVPAGVVIDRTTNLMWTRTPSVVDGRTFWESYRNRSNLTSGSQTGLRVPTLDEWSRLVSGASQPVSAWLAREAGISGLSGYLWANNSIGPERIPIEQWLQVTFVSAASGSRVDYCRWGELIRCSKWYGERLTSRQLLWLRQRFQLQLLLVKSITPGDWWW